MLDVYNFLSTYEGLIYIIFLLGGVVFVRWIWRTWNAWNSAIYGLERDVSHRRFKRAVAANIVWVTLLLGIFLVNSFVIPALPPSILMATPTVDLLVTPTGTISPEMAETLAARPAPDPTDYSEGCVPGEKIIDSPIPGESLSGIVELIGTVDIPKFGFYKFEVSPTGENSWSTIYAGSEIVQNDVLGRIDTGELLSGDYDLRLVPTDNTGTALDPCVVQIRVVGQEK